MKDEEALGEGLLRLDFNSNWTLDELANFLGAVRTAYAGVLSFQQLVDVDDVRRREEFFHRPWPVLVMKSEAADFGARRLATETLALEGEPRLKSIHIASPG
jgi:hypothetical protein